MSNGDQGAHNNLYLPTNKVMTVGNEFYTKLHIKYVLSSGRRSQGTCIILIHKRRMFNWDNRDNGKSSHNGLKSLNRLLSYHFSDNT